jgi:hypothetical protein
MTLLVLEGVLALADYPPHSTEHQRLFVEYDSTRGWRNVPDGVGRYVTPEFALDLSYNAHARRVGPCCTIELVGSPRILWPPCLVDTRVYQPRRFEETIDVDAASCLTDRAT